MRAEETERGTNLADRWALLRAVPIGRWGWGREWAGLVKLSVNVVEVWGGEEEEEEEGGVRGRRH